MKYIEIENKLREVVSRLIVEVKLSTNQNRQDINLVSEDAWIPILKTVLQCPELINLNKEKKNFPGIDLGDLKNRVAIQVTSTTNIEKIKDTLKTFKEKNYKNSFDELFIFVLIDKQKSYSQEAVDKVFDDQIKFITDKHIIDPGDILGMLTSFRVGVQTEILKEFEIILGDIEEKVNLEKIENEYPIALTSNLLKMNFPEYLYVAELELDETAIFELAREKLNYRKGRVTKATLIKLYLVMQGFKEITSWIYHENKIITFINIENDNPFNGIIDNGTIELIESSYFADSEFEDYRNLFKNLLKNTLKGLLSTKNVEWHKKENEFYFLPVNEEETRKETWVGAKTSTRTVYQVQYRKKEPEKVAHYKHLSFDVNFVSIDNDCFCTIRPNWLFTFNKYTKSKFNDDLVSKQKSLEFNQSVRNAVRFIAYFLSANFNDTNSSTIRFYNLVEFDTQWKTQPLVS